MIRFETKVKQELRRRGLSLARMEFDTGISRSTMSPQRSAEHCPCRSTIMAIAYYLSIKAEDLVAGTDVEDYWYGGDRARTPLEVNDGKVP